MGITVRDCRARSANLKALVAISVLDWLNKGKETLIDEESKEESTSWCDQKKKAQEKQSLVVDDPPEKGSIHGSDVIASKHVV
jgi:hypothetical protein